MGSKSRIEGIDEYATQLVEYKVGELIGRYGFTESDRDDLVQELKLDLLRRLPKFNPARAQRSTFIDRVVNHAIATIIKARTAGLRDYRLCRCSLDDLLEDDEGCSVKRMETFDCEDCQLRTGKLSRPVVEMLELSICVQQAMEQLPPDLRELCQRLMNYTVTRISCETGIPRGTIYDLIKKIRTVFKEAGLGDYV
ncbi:MAG: sigma-70 family RNA polymerase sigma factor [candidate division Zixibacteria bacterium]|nr:sigma-70 family RNA polymerase sigma factor [candidate division Zixibacteria bacterium]MBU1471611.1 sigma-70 family RNA polymerase sigma factor [candidate division Zixibacteria bacterium]MBU2626708.1 sigma-70 family RNA polymerase sigma factor [candidate division Zixibacteria bacterium]